MRFRLFGGIAAAVFILSAVILTTFTAQAQDSASLTGTVHDSSGAAVASAQVSVVSKDRGINRTTATNSDGDYSVAALPAPGSYDITVVSTGFKKYQAKGVILQIAQKARVDVALEVGAATAEVNVLGSDVAQVETQSSDLSGTVTGKEISQLQLNGRNFTQLVTLVPGVTNQTGQDEGQVGIAGSVQYSINGGRVEYNNWELDGGDNMDNGSNTSLNVYPSLDAIAEFKVLTSNYGAQYGRSGSGTIEVETKSGTNGFHGDAYEFVRNDIFNARDYFQSDVTPYKKNDFGYTLGGPVFIPNLYNTSKQKTFFFWSQEWRRDRVPATFNLPVPSLAERAGDFTEDCPTSTTPGCPTGGPVLTGLQAYQDSLPVSQALLATIPLPTQVNSDGTSQFVGAAAEPVNWREELLRIDHNINDNNRLTFRYIHDTWQKHNSVPLWTNVGSFPTIGTDFKGPGVSLVTRLSTTFSPTLLNEFVFSYTTDHIVLTNTGAWQRPANLPIGDLFGGNGGGIIPGYNLVSTLYNGGFGEDAGYIPNGPYNANPTYTFRDNVSKSIGKHNLQFGMYVVAAQKNELGAELGAGSIPGYLTFDDTSGGNTSGNAFADMELGYISSFGQQDQRIKYYNRYKIFEPYFQDDFHVTSRLTLNLGLRLSFFGTYRERYHQAYNFDPNKYQPGVTTVSPDDGTVSNLFINGLPNGIVQCGVTAGVPDSCMKNHLFNPAPRIGFAWDPRGNGKTAIRGGYGIFYEHANGNEGNSESLENSPPLANTVQQNTIGGGGVSGYALIGNGGGLSAQFPLSVVAIPTKATWPYVQQWHFDVQQEILKNTVATISYVGSKGTHLSRQTNLNQLHPIAAAQNPYKVGEAIGPNDCGTTFDANGVPTGATTPSNVPITGQAAINLGVAACGTNADLFRQYAGYGDITNLQFAASSIYHAFQTSVRHTIGGLQLNFSYTYSHSIDDSSDRFDSAFSDAFNPSVNRASSAFDQRHVLDLSYVYDLPFFKQPGLTNKLLGGWQYSGITTFATGTPYGVVFAGDNAGVANGVGSSSRPDLIGDPYAIQQSPLDQSSPLFANPDAFAAPRGLTFGDSGRNLLRNPRRINFDMSLFKHFVIKEQTAFEFRAEAYNIFNHTEWLPVAGDSGSGAANNASGVNTFASDGFLRTQGTHAARILQLGLKFIF
jgi:Carboxypeptidase regulatory-like domain